MKVELILGCWGREQNNFSCCSGTSNVILDITKNTEKNVAIAEFLDKVYNLFDKPLYSNAHTAIWNIQDKFSTKGKPVFQDQFFKQMEEFCILHKKCGVYLRLNMQVDNPIEIGEEMKNIIFIVDIDGTVCDSIPRVKRMCERAGCEYTWQNLDQLWSKEHLREFFNDEEIKKDTVIPGSEKIFKLIKKCGAHLVFLTGRNDSFRAVTSKWLVDNLGVPKDVGLIMRTPEFEDVDMQSYKETVFLEKVYKNQPKSFYVFFDDDERIIPRYAKYGVVFKAPKCWEDIEC